MHDRRRRALALTLVSACLVQVAASNWSSCAPRCALRVDAFGLDPPMPRPGDRVNVTLAGTFREDARGIDAETNPTVSVRVFYRAFSRWFAVKNARGPLCADFHCPVLAAADTRRATVRGALDVPPDAPAGWYRLVLAAVQDETALFCVDARVKFRSAVSARDANRGRPSRVGPSASR